MSTVISAEQLHLAYGTRPLLDHVDFRIERGERVCLLGRNGEGKSSLLRLITGEASADDGSFWVADGANIAVLPQELPEKRDKTAYQTVAEAFPETADLLLRFEALSMTGDGSEAHLNELQKVQEQLELLDGWRLDQRIRQILEQYEIDPEARLPELSGGWQRRVLLAKALVSEPDLLLLDEPTNHLDVPAIRWLEQTLSQFKGAVLFVSHDRAFIRAMATRILELDRGHLTSWPGNYDLYLELKEKALEEEERQNALFDKKLAQEEAWIRQGIKARRTRNQGRVRALKAMREEHRQRREVQGTTRMTIEAAERSGKLVVETKHAHLAFGDDPVLEDVNLLLLRGDKVGVIGENGSGKTTLVRLLLGDLEPTEGSVRQGTKLEVAYFDQLRGELDPDKTALDNLSEGREYIEVGGQKKHVMGYLSEFLFTPDRARTQVRVLSGGERARLLLAKLFSKPANILVLDEPTNDLDVPTLELLESRLVDFTGTVILISHDREFLDNVVGSVLYLDGQGHVDDFVGGYSDWRRQGGEFPSETPVSGRSSASRRAPQAEPKPAPEPTPRRRKKLSYKLQRELEQMPQRIQSLEEDVAALNETVADPDFYQAETATVESTLARLSEREKELEAAIARWMELEEEAEASAR